MFSIAAASLAAGFAALLAPTVALFPCQPLAWGGIALIAGMATVPGVVVAAAAVLPMAPSVRRSSLVAFALVGLFAVHTSEIPLTIALVLIIASASIRSDGVQTWTKHVLANGALAGVDPLFLIGGFTAESLGTPETVVEAHEARKSLAVDVGRCRERRDVAHPWRTWGFAMCTTAIPAYPAPAGRSTFGA